MSSLLGDPKPGQTQQINDDGNVEWVYPQAVLEPLTEQEIRAIVRDEIGRIEQDNTAEQVDLKKTNPRWCPDG